MINQQKKLDTKRGFTLIEMLIAVLIFSLSLAALMTISSRGLRVAKNAERDVTADYLAMEAIEIARNLRDNTILRGGGFAWSDIFSGGDGWAEDEGCLSERGDSDQQACSFSLASGQPKLEQCSGSGCRVFYHPSQNIYLQTKTDSAIPLGYQDSGFVRKIYITQLRPDEVVVEVFVSWQGGEIHYSENLFLWQ